MRARPATEVLVANKARFVAFAAVWLFVAAASAALHSRRADGGDDWLWIMVATFVVAAAACSIWAAIKPPMLRLEPDGFVVSGGLSGASQRILWAEITGFFVFHQSRLGELVGYNYRPGRGTNFPMQRAQRRMGADGAISGRWGLSPADLAAKLNDYRNRAMESVAD